jgi:hypothetical protein
LASDITDSGRCPPLQVPNKTPQHVIEPCKWIGGGGRRLPAFRHNVKVVVEPGPEGLKVKTGFVHLAHVGLQQQSAVIRGVGPQTA